MAESYCPSISKENSLCLEEICSCQEIPNSVEEKQNSILENIRNYFFYGKECYGKNGEDLILWKFRTMKKNSDKKIEKYLDEGFDQTGKLQVDEKDYTKMGKFLRRYWIDELPQVYNLIKGDIKLVGVRPVKKETYNRFPKKLQPRVLDDLGWIGPQYADNSDLSYNKKIENYLDEHDKKPLKTDIKYFFKFINNVLHGMRSS